MATVPKLKLVGESFAVVPTPLSVTFCGLPAALSVMLNAAVRVPDAVGLNLTLIVQLAPAANEVPQVVVWEKSPAFVPVIAIVVIVKLAVPVFFRVAVVAALVVPIAWVEKDRLVGDRVTTGPLLRLKVAVRDLAAVILTEQLPDPVQAPLQPANVEPVAAPAVRVTTVPLLKFAEHVLGQLIPDGLLVTLPEPVPANVTVSGKTGLKVAVTDSAALMTTEHAPVPVQAPLQPAKAEPVVALAVSVTVTPTPKFAVQVLGQVIPAGLLVTLPLPVPANVTVRGWVGAGVWFKRMLINSSPVSTRSTSGAPSRLKSSTATAYDPPLTK
jgi:phage tail protein X